MPSIRELLLLLSTGVEAAQRHGLLMTAQEVPRGAMAKTGAIGVVLGLR